MKVSVLGTGYVGLVSGVCLAEKGHDVVCVDVDEAKVNLINQGRPPIFENGIEALLKKNVGKRLSSTTDLLQAVHGTDLSLIAVGTPFNGQEIDLTYIKEVAWQIGRALRTKRSYHVVVVKSTVVPGTTDNVVRPILEEASGKKAGVDFGIGMNPEFLTEGEAIDDFMNPDRIVLGGNDRASLDAQACLYDGFKGVPVVRTNNATAEMIKYASNSLLATMISFSNEIGNLCAALGGVDIVDVMSGVHSSRYLTVTLPTGERHQPGVVSFLSAGCGFGGSCLPKDVSALAAHGKQAGIPMPLLEAVLQVNKHQPELIIKLLKKHFPSLSGVRVTVLGLAFRPDTNDMRESPAIPIVRGLLREGAVIRAYDPTAMEEAAKVFKGQPIVLCHELEDAIKDSDAIVLVTRWKQFEMLPELFKRQEVQPLVVDGRRFLDKREIARYEGIGT
jgi:UDPglucose 6-dehydrogenase/GDP-mannose 6-dehydrogenase